MSGPRETSDSSSSSTFDAETRLNDVGAAEQQNPTSSFLQIFKQKIWKPQRQEERKSEERDYMEPSIRVARWLEVTQRID
uniref:Uncharacterized protein n=1 Tax=Steinernema glaseri TaxID=37863 RepID=A0A1I8A940_9BILA